MDEKPSSNATAWAVLALLAVLVGAIQMARPFAFVRGSWEPLFTLGGGFALIGFLFSRFRTDHEFTHICIVFVQMLLFSCMGAILSYQLARWNAPLADRQMWAFDRALGFDWMAWMRWTDDRPAIAAALRFAYRSLIPQIVVVVLVLGLARRLSSLRTVILGGILTGLACVLVSPLLPALGYPPLMGVGVRTFQHVTPLGGMVQLHDLLALRRGAMITLHVPSLKGIITFPSYHAGLSLVTAYGFWSCRPAWIKWPGIALAMTTIAATPIIGGHYVADTLAGLAIAGLCLAAAARAVHWQPASSLRAWPSRRSRAAFAR